MTVVISISQAQDNEAYVSSLACIVRGLGFGKGFNVQEFARILYAFARVMRKLVRV